MLKTPSSRAYFRRLPPSRGIVPCLGQQYCQSSNDLVFALPEISPHLVQRAVFPQFGEVQGILFDDNGAAEHPFSNEPELEPDIVNEFGADSVERAQLLIVGEPGLPQDALRGVCGTDGGLQVSEDCGNFRIALLEAADGTLKIS
ncbi:hypothetical protein ACHAQF_005012 [Verticillium nonalfalfae]